MQFLRIYLFIFFLRFDQILFRVAVICCFLLPQCFGESRDAIKDSNLCNLENVDRVLIKYLFKHLFSDQSRSQLVAEKFLKFIFKFIHLD